MKKRFSIREHESASTTAAPITFRLPKTGTNDPYFGVPRTFWNQRVLPNKFNKGKPPIKSFVVKTTGSKRGIRLILFESAKRYFQALAAQQATVEVTS